MLTSQTFQRNLLKFLLEHAGTESAWGIIFPYSTVFLFLKTIAIVLITVQTYSTS